jgi:mono/diheme cytochrome c family protein
MTCLVVALIAGSASVDPALAQRAELAPEAGAPSRALLDRYCVSCHNERLKTAGINLDTADIARVDLHRELFEKVARKLRSGQMPPQGRPRPEAPAVATFVSALESELDRVGATAPNPGRVASHRLNRTEYINVIRDLLALEIDGEALLPSDMAGFGFDNNADVLAMTPALMDRYITAATKVSRLAVGTRENRPSTEVYRIPTSSRQDARMGEDSPFASHGGLVARHTFPLDGEYLFKIRLSRDDVGGSINGNIAEREYHIDLRVDHELVKRFTVGGKFTGQVKYNLSAGLIAPPDDDQVHQQVALYNQNADKDLEIRLPVKAGTRLVSATFANVAPSAMGTIGDNVVAGLSTLEIRGAFGGAIPDETPSRERIFVCRPSGPQDEESCARRILRTLTRRAYRRPVTDLDLQPLMAIYERGRATEDFDTGIARALEALLSMPTFLLRAEIDPDDRAPGAIYPISDLELATRLSFFLWRSLPDDELLVVAERGELRNPSVLEAQTRRMLSDPRATRWMSDFLGQWLQVRNLQSMVPDPSKFRGFDPTLRDAMITESELFFESQVREDRSLLDLLRADYTFVNARLAEHYGIPDVYGSHFRRIPVTDPVRQGLLGHGSVLTVTSYANRTSVVLRGKWVLETLLGSPPPPPPPNVPPLEENDPAGSPTSLREKMEQHRANPVCASCHSNLDPLGFTLENFDAIGRWRDDDEGAPIDAAITWNGANVDGPASFRETLLEQSEFEFVRTVTEKLLTFALGRGLNYLDAPTVRQLVRDAARDDYRWSSLILGIVESEPFQERVVQDGSQTQAEQ